MSDILEEFELAADVHEMPSIGVAMMVDPKGEHPPALAAINPRVYIIYDMSLLDNGNGNPFKGMDPTTKEGIGHWIETEDDDNYDYGYLADECGRSSYAAAADAETPHFGDEVYEDIKMGYGFEFHYDGADYYMKIGSAPYFEESWAKVTDNSGYDGMGAWVEGFKIEYIDFEDVPDKPQGRHRKWCGELSWNEWLRFASEFIIDLDERGYPTHYEQTMGSLTMHGLMPAVAIDNSEGWEMMGGPDVITSHFWTTFERYQPLG